MDSPPLKEIDLCDTAQKRAYSRSVFAVVAPVYNRIAAILSFGRDRAWKQLLFAALPSALQDSPSGATASCLDLACGTGDITRALSLRYPEARVCGIDLCEPMLAEARREMEQEPRPEYSNISLKQGDLCALPVESACVDLLTGGYALRNAPDLDLALSEMARVLKPSALALFLEFSKPTNKILAGLEYHLLKFWGGLWGLLLHGKPEIYTYIAENLKHFPDRSLLAAKIERSGLQLLSSRLLLGGFIALTICRRKSLPKESEESEEGKEGKEGKESKDA